MFKLKSNKDIYNFLFMIAVIIILLIVIYIYSTININYNKIDKWMIGTNPNKIYTLDELSKMGKNDLFIEKK